MLATLEVVQLLDEAEMIAQMVVQSEAAVNYRQSLDRLRQDKEAQALISQFVHMKERYEEVQRFGKYHPDHDIVTKGIRQLKREVDLNAAVSAFKKAENELQKLLDEISVLIGKSVSEHIKVPTGNPFFDSLSSCGGGCGSGGSCGCSTK
ncbi:MAG TPA: YlbF family regulator [Bacillus sp. (in: firmicutes)]|nr:YlbF family regulator [Bacillus sp. (in: firmicutes)]